jgi:hypothetical protein
MSLEAHVRRSLPRKRRDRGRVVIHGADGDVLRIVEIHPSVDASAEGRRG